MKELVVSGGKPLNGRIKCDGAKNAALPILAATLLTHGVTHLTQIPYSISAQIPQRRVNTPLIGLSTITLTRGRIRYVVPTISLARHGL